MDSSLLKVGYIVQRQMSPSNNKPYIQHGRIVAIRPSQSGEGYLVDYVTREGSQYTFNPVTTNSPHSFYYRGRRVGA